MVFLLNQLVTSLTDARTAHIRARHIYEAMDSVAAWDVVNGHIRMADALARITHHLAYLQQRDGDKGDAPAGEKK